MRQDEVLDLARSARIELTEDELSELGPSVDSLIRFVKAMDSVEAEPLELSNISGLKNVFRRDEVVPFEDLQALWESCGANEDGFFPVPKHRMQ